MRCLGDYVLLQLRNDDDGKIIRLPAIVTGGTPYGREQGRDDWDVLTLHVLDTRPGHAPVWVARDVRPHYYDTDHWTWVGPRAGPGWPFF